MPSLRVGGMSGIVLFLYVVAIFGALHLLASAYPDARMSRSWKALGF